MNILEILAQELPQIFQEVALTIERVVDLPFSENEDYFQRVNSKNTESFRYWIPWTEEIGAFVDRDGSEILVLLQENVLDVDFESIILGFTSVLTGVCLNLQGKVAIHANAVSLKGLACAFAGHSGIGKSTLSTYCAEQGAGFITDDVLVVKDNASVLPGNPRLKLYPYTAESLGLEVIENTDYKIFYDLAQWGVKFHDLSVPLGVIYLLAEDSEREDIYSEAIPPSQAVFELLTHSYYANELIKDNPQVFNAYINLVTNFPIKKLIYPRDFAKLPEVYDFLMQEVSQLSIL